MPKPHPDFPLFPHATKRWAKKIRGKFHFFGPWRDPEGALEEWLRVKDHLLAGREPPPKDAPEIPEPAGMTVETVVNAFLTQKELLRDNGEIQPRTFTELHATGVRIAEAFGKQRLVSDLQPSDFAALRATLAKTRGAVALGNEIQRVRSYFRWAYEDGLIEQPVRFGTAFRKPSAKTVRIERSRIGSRDLNADEIRKLIDEANVPMKAMILLGVNFGQGNGELRSGQQRCGIAYRIERRSQDGLDGLSATEDRRPASGPPLARNHHRCVGPTSPTATWNSLRFGTERCVDVRGRDSHQLQVFHDGLFHPTSRLREDSHPASRLSLDQLVWLRLNLATLCNRDLSTAYADAR